MDSIKRGESGLARESLLSQPPILNTQLAKREPSLSKYTYVPRICEHSHSWLDFVAFYLHKRTKALRSSGSGRIKLLAQPLRLVLLIWGGGGTPNGSNDVWPDQTPPSLKEKRWMLKVNSLVRLGSARGKERKVGELEVRGALCAPIYLWLIRSTCQHDN